MRPDFDEHSDDALHLSALGRSDPPRSSPLREMCAMPDREVFAFHDLVRANAGWAITRHRMILREQRRIARRQWWKRTIRTFIWLTVVLAAAALLIIGSW